MHDNSHERRPIPLFLFKHLPSMSLSLDRTHIHLMELPRKILIGDNVIESLGGFIKDLNRNASKIAIVTGHTVQAKAGQQCRASIDASSLDNSWHIVTDASLDSVNRLQIDLEKCSPDFIVGLGGGRSVDVAKMTAFRLSKPFVSAPTSASHDGIASPFVSVKGLERPHSIKASSPIGVLADTWLLSQAPKRLLASGCGDLVAKITAVRDWELAKEEKNEYFGAYAANLAKMSADIIIKQSHKFRENNIFGARTIIEALISAGVAACIAGSSRPCSGSEHLFSHALEYVVGNNCGLHGERVGIGTIIMAKLHGLDWREIVRTLKEIGAPTTGHEIDIEEQNMVKALLLAPYLRPERYTILNKVRLNEQSAKRLLKDVDVVI
jgi:glycerol-1-phosphate dehydrogenase [NAD(P)+]